MTERPSVTVPVTLSNDTDEVDSVTDFDAERWKLCDDHKITVCDSCLRAGCWAGITYCEKYKSAKLRSITVEEARCLGLEDPSTWIELRKAEGYK